MRHKVPHINVDAFPLVDSHFSGVGHYTLGIVRGFDELSEEGKITYSLIVPRNTANEINKYNLSNYRKIITNPIPNRVLRAFMKYHISFPVDIFTGRGLYWFPSFLAWPLLFNKSTVVIHDVTYLSVPDCVEKNNAKYLERTVPFSLKNASSVIAVSEFSKSEIIKYYKTSPSQIAVASPSIDRTRFYRRSQEEIKRVKLKYDIYENSYILSVGNIEPRKNYSRLISAYTQLPRKITNKYPLVIIGAGGWNNEDILIKIQAAKEKGYKIINPKYFVSDEDMPAIYSGAKLFIFVPIYEGFGMSPLEAYSCKTPVIASKVASVPEAAGSAAEYVNPYVTLDITNKIIEMLINLDKDQSYYHKSIPKELSLRSWRRSAEITASKLTGLPLDYFKDKQL